jgi:hypothetical protein
MRHPFEAIPAAARARALIPLLLLTAIVMAGLALLDRDLKTAASPAGIASFELAGNVATADTIIGLWGWPARIEAGFSLGLDFLFIALYSTTLALACLWAGEGMRARGWSLAGLGRWLAWGLGLAAVLDATEDVALLVQLVRSATAPWPQVAWLCATTKFLLGGAGACYAAFGAAFRLIPARSSAGSPSS